MINKRFRIFEDGTSLEMKCNITDADSIVCNIVQGRAADRCVVCACFHCSVLRLGFSVVINVHCHQK
jgi:hypothetical protein